MDFLVYLLILLLYVWSINGTPYFKERMYAVSLTMLFFPLVREALGLMIPAFVGTFLVAFVITEITLAIMKVRSGEMRSLDSIYRPLLEMAVRLGLIDKYTAQLRWMLRDKLRSKLSTREVVLRKNECGEYLLIGDTDDPLVRVTKALINKQMPSPVDQVETEKMFKKPLSMLALSEMDKSIAQLLCDLRDNYPTYSRDTEEADSTRQWLTMILKSILDTGEATTTQITWLYIAP